MFLMHPACLLISFCSALCYALYQSGRRALRLMLSFMLPMMLLAALLNPAFNHEGATILRYLPSGNPLTLESILYGLASAVMLAAILLWFGCYTAVMSSDKIVYLFGRAAPALSLILSMTLRFVPRFRMQMHVVSDALRGMRGGEDGGNLLQRFRNGVAVLSVLVTWSLENAIESADSMKSRGYGLPGRSAFSLYRFDERDKLALVWLIFCGVFIGSGWLAGALQFRYFPMVEGSGYGPFSVAFLLCYLLLCLTPLFLAGKEDLKWKRLQSEI